MVLSRALQVVGLGRPAAHLLWLSQVGPLQFDRYYGIVLFRVNETRIDAVSRAIVNGRNVQKTDLKYDMKQCVH